MHYSAGLIKLLADSLANIHLLQPATGRGRTYNGTLSSNR